MSWRLTLETEARGLARRFGLIPYLHRVRHLKNKIFGATGYEARFDEALLGAIHPGDVVWDIGANVGLYTAKFLDRVGSEGRVIAFEPVQTCAAEIERRLGTATNLTLIQAAVGAMEGELPMELSDDPLGVTHHVGIRGEAPSASTTVVKVVSGDGLLKTAEVPAPSVIKVDVEGFELEVIEGMSQLLSRADLRGIFIEVHFAQLAERGIKQAPGELVQRLQAAGFATRWADASHLVGERAV